MILQEYIGIKISSKNLQYYKNLGYKVKNKETVAVNYVLEDEKHTYSQIVLSDYQDK